MAYPENVGIKAMEIYVPAQCLDQTLFEKHQGVSAGKYTIGLGLKYMNYCTDREDVCSLALTAVSSLLRKYDIDPKSIGRLEVGTESLIDKAKSVKSVLTTLFEPHGNTSLEGIDTIHACYGGTSALFNAVNWVESRCWDGRDAIVVASDIALYDQPASRPTGGAGCVAMLVGPNAPLSLDPNLRGVYMTNTYDFYKPNLKVEFPIVNGHDSIVCYQQALDGCHKDLLRRGQAAAGATNGDKPAMNKVLDLFDYMAFHTPNCKLVSKSYGRLKYNDILKSPDQSDWEEIPPDLRSLGYEESLKDKNLERALVAMTKSQFQKQVEPCIAAPSRCGNMYTGSLYCSLISLISNIDLSNAKGKTIGLFSFGSGAASSLFTLRVTGDLSNMVQKIDLMSRLEKRHIGTPEEYEEACALRLNAYGKKSYKPVGDVVSLLPGTYYLENIDDEYRRSYLVKGEAQSFEQIFKAYEQQDVKDIKSRIDGMKQEQVPFALCILAMQALLDRRPNILEFCFDRGGFEYEPNFVNRANSLNRDKDPETWEVLEKSDFRKLHPCKQYPAFDFDIGGTHPVDW